MRPIKTYNTRDACSEASYELAKENHRVIVMSADHDRTFQLIKQNMRERYIDAGIAEADMIGIAAGLALSGRVPYVTGIAGILATRACEQIRDDVCYNRLPVRIVGIAAGLAYGPLGTTHHAVEDLAMMRAIPGMTVIQPADAVETRKVVKASADYKGPIYIRIGTGNDPLVYEEGEDFSYEIGKSITLKGGDDVKIFGIGGLLAYARRAAEALEEEGISAGIINVHTVKPLDEDFLLDQARKAKVILTLEDHNRLGGLGGALAETFAGKISCPMRILGIPDKFSDVDSREGFYARYGLDAAGIVSSAKQLLKTS
jgi:transketolase